MEKDTIMGISHNSLLDGRAESLATVRKDGKVQTEHFFLMPGEYSLGIPETEWALNVIGEVRINGEFHWHGDKDSLNVPKGTEVVISVGKDSAIVSCFHVHSYSIGADAMICSVAPGKGI